MTFNSGHVVAIIFYPILMVISAVGNITVFVILLRRRKKGRSRINSMLMHLSIADLLVTFLMMPLETAWNYTVVWHGGDVLCRIMSFNRIFGLYLSSFVLVCISVDRYFAVLRPMQINDRRGRWMLVGAWIAAFVCSLPQMVVFQALTHPEYTWYVQCITTGMLTTRTAAVAYAVFGMVAIYCVPLSVIIFSYASIIVEIYRRSREPVDDKLRRSSLGFLGRAKARTLKMTIIIVLVFFVCSTPYYIMMVWYWVDEKAVQHVDPRVQKGLLLFCSANSCMNPIVYGAFNIRTRRGTSQVRCRPAGTPSGVVMHARARQGTAARPAPGTRQARARHAPGRRPVHTRHAVLGFGGPAVTSSPNFASRLPCSSLPGVFKRSAREAPHCAAPLCARPCAASPRCRLTGKFRGAGLAFRSPLTFI
ncbi:hypothetical protein ONE63_005319 [Megalurothrips usitatus]|uniref:G-protein coupled receptors family 1 profile domain-containing protein n=1 Tax=Megalurothrips usitatus TaxID=439358 RepID=A0AAV7XYZ2_9NEOP|nr:hypothetical protein ONE63_005319 [Megalurothrips usitatus]